MIRTLFITLGCLILAGLFSIPAAAQGVEPPSEAPRWRGDQAPAVNPATFQDAEEAGRYGTTFGRGLHKLGRGVNMVRSVIFSRLKRARVAFKSR